MEGCGGLIHAPCAKAPLFLQPGHTRLQHGPGARGRRAYLDQLLVGGVGLLNAELEQGGVIHDETTESVDACLDEVGTRIAGRRQSVDGGGEQVEGPCPEGGDESVLGAEEAVNGPCRGPHLVGEGAHGHGAEAVGCHDPLRGVEQGGAGALVMFSGSTHLDSIT